MHVVFLGATNRGVRFLHRLIALLPAESKITVASFPEAPGEPLFLEEIREVAMAAGGNFFQTRNIAGSRMARPSAPPLWKPRET